MEYDIAQEYCKIIRQKLILKNYDAAMMNAKKLITYDANFAEGYYFLGLCNFAAGDFKQSIENYTKCLELDNSLPKAHYNLGISKYYLGRYKEAVIHMENALRLFTKTGEKDACSKCQESIDFIKEEQNL